MKMNGLFQNRLTGRTVALLSRGLDLRSARHNVISGNLANIDTPGYRPKELDFKKALQGAVERTNVPLRRTNPKHFSHYPGGHNQGKGSFFIQEKEVVAGASNQLNIDEEMAKMVQNNLLYEASARLLAKKFEALKRAIQSTGR